jgi:hypothetical protein
LYTNSAINFEYMVAEHINYSHCEYFSLAHTVKDINRLFRFDTAGEILHALKQETSAFAQWCVQEIESKSSLALEATMRLIRNAKRLNYYEIQLQELVVAKNILLKNPDFDTFIENKLNRFKDEIKFETREISKEQVDDLFVDHTNILSKIKLDVKPNSLLPHKEYSEKYPDCFRIWINESPRANGEIRKFFDYEIKHFLMQNM